MITVVVSVYNTGQYLSKALDALLGQTYEDFELLLVDDGSTDGSGEICEREAKRSTKIRVFHKPNGGLSSARNYGIEHAAGEYIIFPDPDDWVEPDYLQGLLDIRGRHGADLSVCGHYMTWDGRDILWNASARERVFHTGEALEELMKPLSFCGYAWNKLYRMDVIREHGLRFDEELGMAQDLHFAFRYFQYCESIAYDPRPLYHYSRDNGGVTAYATPLTARKLSGLKTYEKIAALAHGRYPGAEAAAYSTLCAACLQYINLYYRNGMDQPETLAMLRRTFAQYQSYYYASEAVPLRRKLPAPLAPRFPRAYYAVTGVNRFLRFTLPNKIGKHRDPYGMAR
ncbi:MAG: glycosyltransferase [Oscillospiraceae bacterium]|nr:glycosyltransferase [Oscillospiraceae bacterium]